MNVTIIGATGMVGSRVAIEATRRGHQLTTTSQSSRPSPDLPAGTVHVTLDANDPDAVARVLEPADVAVVSIRPPVGEEASLAATTATIFDAAAATGTRLLLVGGAGPLRSPRDPYTYVLDDRLYVPEQYRAIAAASSAQLEACVAHQHPDWTYISPPAVLEPGERTGAYRRGTTTLLVDADGASRISAEDFAVAVLDELEQPGADRHFTVAETAHALGSRLAGDDPTVPGAA